MNWRIIKRRDNLMLKEYYNYNKLMINNKKQLRICELNCKWLKELVHNNKIGNKIQLARLVCWNPKSIT